MRVGDIDTATGSFKARQRTWVYNPKRSAGSELVRKWRRPLGGEKSVTYLALHARPRYASSLSEVKQR